MTLEAKYNLLKKILKSLNKVVIAYSGGVDSTFLLKVAADMLGTKNVLACIATGPHQPKKQFFHAAKIAEGLGVKLIQIKPEVMADKNFIANKADRCFHCKVNICRDIIAVAKKGGFGHVVFGSNFDDLKDFRPGNRAMEMYNIKCPLAKAKLTKDDIRKLSRKLNLPTADLPANPCLVSRLEYGLEITKGRLAQIDKAEEFLRTLGLVEFRVRHHGNIARIEVNPKDFKKIVEGTARLKIIKRLKSLGFKYITIDLQGFRSGAMNEILPNSNKGKSQDIK